MQSHTARYAACFGSHTPLGGVSSDSLAAVALLHIGWASLSTRTTGSFQAVRLSVRLLRSFRMVTLKVCADGAVLSF